MADHQDNEFIEYDKYLPGFSECMVERLAWERPTDMDVVRRLCRKHLAPFMPGPGRNGRKRKKADPDKLPSSYELARTIVWDASSVQRLLETGVTHEELDAADWDPEEMRSRRWNQFRAKIADSWQRIEKLETRACELEAVKGLMTNSVSRVPELEARLADVEARIANLVDGR